MRLVYSILADDFKIEPPKKDLELKKRLDAFMEELWAATRSHPFARGMRIWGDMEKDAVGIEAEEYWGTEIHLKSIMTFSDKNAGSASKALRFLCDLADKHQVLLTLTVSPIKNAGSANGKSLTATQLKNWYKKNGFVPTKKFNVDGKKMERQPKEPT